MSNPSDLVRPPALKLEPVAPDAPPRLDRKLVALLGAPGAGKATLFQRLTGVRPIPAGDSSAPRTGRSRLPSGNVVEVTDLPGEYRLHPGAREEVLVRDVLFGLHAEMPSPDLIVFVVDPARLPEQLPHALELIQLGRPFVLALNDLENDGRDSPVVDELVLERRLGVPVIVISATTGEGVGHLRRVMDRDVVSSTAVFRRRPRSVERVLDRVAARLPRRGLLSAQGRQDLAYALLLDDGEDDALARGTPAELQDELRVLRRRLDSSGAGWREAEVLGVAEAIRGIVAEATESEAGPSAWREPVDRAVTHPVLGPLVFVALLVAVFQGVYEGAAPLVDRLDAGLGALGAWIAANVPAGSARSLVVEGVLGGVGATLTFVPHVVAFFLLFSLLASSGVLARAALVLDRVVGRAGLPGRAFLPGPGPDPEDVPPASRGGALRHRLLSRLLAPSLSIVAPLPIYALLIGAFVPDRAVGFLSLRGLVLALVVLLGLAAAALISWALQRTSLGESRPLYVLELPPLRVPAWRAVAREVRDRIVGYLRAVFPVILVGSVAIWFLTTYPGAGDAGNELARGIAAERRSGTADEVARMSDELAELTVRRSFAGRAANFLEPAIAPLGLDARLGVSLLASLVARDAAVSSLAVVGSVGEGGTQVGALRERLPEVPGTRGRRSYPPLAAASLLAFFALAGHSLGTVLAARRATQSWRWPLLLFGTTLGLAWVAAFLIHQGGRLFAG